MLTPLKRFPGVSSASTRLKSGVNERSVHYSKVRLALEKTFWAIVNRNNPGGEIER